MSGSSGGGPHAIAAFENAEANVMVAVSSTSCARVNSAASSARRASSMLCGSLTKASV